MKKIKFFREHVVRRSVVTAPVVLKFIIEFYILRLSEHHTAEILKEIAHDPKLNLQNFFKRRQCFLQKKTRRERCGRARV